VEQFQERLARLDELSVDELQTLRQEMVTAFDAADAEGDVESMQHLADEIDKVRAQVTATEATATAAPEPEPEPETETEKPVEQAPEPVASDPAPESDPEPDEKPVEDPVEETPPAEEPPSEEAPAEQPDTPQPESSGTNKEEEPVADITADEVPEENRPLAASAPAVTIRAGGDIPGLTAGSQLGDMDDVVEAMTRKVNAMRGVSGDGEHIIVASLRVEDEVPDDRVLRPGDLNGNSKKIRNLLSDRDALRPEGLIAAGWCAPRSPIYEVPTMGTSARPVRDSLPTFNAERGGITWMQPPALPNMGGVGLWRHNGSTWQSFNQPAGIAGGAAGTTKPCFTVPCGTEQAVDVDALTLCLNFFNMTARAFPEWIRANTDLTMVAQARFAEQVLLSQMFNVVATGNACATSPMAQVGAARDFLLTVRVAAASHRWKNRLGATAPLQMLAPAWVRDAVAVDLGLQQPGDDTFSTSTAEVDGYFRDFDVQPIWFIDDAPGQAAFVACAGFPTAAQWLLYPTGSFVRLDTGDLNLGVVRDKADVQANTYSEFSETFEAVAYMGPAAPNQWVLRGSTAIDIRGSFGAGQVIT
jgi:hypothetical protein